MATPFAVRRFGAPVISFSNWQSASDYLSLLNGPGLTVTRRLLRWDDRHSRWRWRDVVLQRAGGVR